MAQRGRMGSRVSGIFACLVLSDRSVLWRGPIRDCALRRVLAGAESRDRITSVFFMCRAVPMCRSPVGVPVRARVSRIDDDVLRSRTARSGVGWHTICATGLNVTALRGMERGRAQNAHVC